MALDRGRLIMSTRRMTRERSNRNLTASFLTVCGLTPRCSPLATLAAELDIVRPRMKDSRSSAVRGAFFFVGAMLAFTSCEAVDIFALGHYEHKWTPGENFRLATLASAVLMGIVATLFAVTTVLGARHTGVNRSSC